MKQYIWFLISIISISVFYFCMIIISDDYWFHAESTSIFAALLILLFILYMTRKPFPVRIKNIIIIIYFVVVCLISISWIQSKKLTFQQKEYLIAIRKNVDEGQLSYVIHRYLLKTLYKYQIKENDTFTIRNIFEQQILSDSTFPTFKYDMEFFKNDSMRLNISPITDDEIILIGESAITGFDEKFRNFSGRTGKMQYTGMLNKDGIKYVRNN